MAKQGENRMAGRSQLETVDFNFEVERSDSGEGDLATETSEVSGPALKLYQAAFPDVRIAIDSGLTLSAATHYSEIGKAEISAGVRHAFPEATRTSADDLIRLVVPMIHLASEIDPTPWKILSPSDQAVIRVFIAVAFETIYANAYDDLRRARAEGNLDSGFRHWLKHGRQEVIDGRRLQTEVTKWASIHSSVLASLSQSELPALGVVGDWGSVMHACAKGQEYLRPERGTTPVGSFAQEALRSARSAFQDLLAPTSESQVADHVYACDPRLVAFYLPQHHQVKENDEWWGAGFTEWTNVRKAKPNFVGHYQPHVPENNDYYDLSDPNVQRRQTSLAKEYGVSTFCYYMYWFAGRRILERPLDQMLADKAINHEFCICWANENWTRTWDGKASDILIGQVHTSESDRRFILDAIKYLRDPRYMRIEGKLALLVYRVDLLANCRRTAQIWREEARKAGLGELHLCAVQFYGVTDPEPWGFDAAVEFPPHGWLVQENLPAEAPQILNGKFAGQIFDYGRCHDWAMAKPIPRISMVSRYLPQLGQYRPTPRYASYLC